MDIVRISSLELDCIVGIRAYERDREQRVRLDLALGVDARRAGRSGRISQTVDYDMVAEHLIAMLRFRRYQLIEMAAEELCAMLLLTEPELMQVQLCIEKPGALEGRARSACVEVVRRLADFEPEQRAHAWGSERLMLRTRDAESSVIRLAPGQTGAPPYDASTRCLTWLLQGEARLEDRPLQPGVPLMRERGGLPQVTNPSSRDCTLFVCVVPPQQPGEPRD